MEEKRKKGKTFEERLKETIEEYSGSEAEYDRWLRERGLDRETIRRASEGRGLEKRSEAKEAFERIRKEIDSEIEKLRAGVEERRPEDNAAYLPAWAIKV